MRISILVLVGLLGLSEFCRADILLGFFKCTRQRDASSEVVVVKLSKQDIQFVFDDTSLSETFELNNWWTESSGGISKRTVVSDNGNWILSVKLDRSPIDAMSKTVFQFSKGENKMALTRTVYFDWFQPYQMGSGIFSKDTYSCRALTL